MRRGHPRGRGNRQMHRPQHQNQNRQQQHQQVSSGSIMTGHLQGLKDIDMELELLKRKREIIEQQQQMLSENYRPRNDYEQPAFDQPRENRYDDYTRLYDNPRDSNLYGGEAPSRKRAHIQVWENESPPKRMAAPSRGVRKAFGSRLGPPPNNPRPEFHRPNIRPAAPKPFKSRPAQFVQPQRKKEFYPTKVTKPSAAVPPVKLANYQQADRKKLVTDSLAHSKPTVRIPSAQPDWILRVDTMPSRQLNGRLELGLGSIIKDLKYKNPESEDLFKQQLPMRAMKQCVRERIRTAMLGKVVNSTESVRTAYYDMFPTSTDEDVIMKGYEVAHKDCDFIATKSDDPEQYFKRNIIRLMSGKLEEMTNKLEEIYCADNPGHQLKKKPRTNPGKRKAQGEARENAAESKTDDDQPTEPQSNVEDVETKADGEPSTVSEPKTEDELNTEGILETSEVQANPGDAQAASDNTTEQNETDDAQNKEDQSTPPDAGDKASENDTYQSFINDEKYMALDRLMTYKIVHLIKKFSPTILKIMDVDGMYRKTKASIINETKKKLLGNKEATTPHQQNAPIKVTNEKRFLTPLQYYVKILGKPSLPKRKAMESFFEQYQPKSIKKHRNIHNLLFVGFADKEPFEKMLAASGTVIGRFTLDIKVSERNNDKVKPGNTDSLGKPDQDETNETDTDTIGADLDEQINDLLTSIRKNEEESYSDDIVMESPAKQVISEETAETESTSVDGDLSQDDVKIKDKDTAADDEDVVDLKDVPQNANEVIEIKDVEAQATPDNGEAEINTVDEEPEKKDAVEALKTEVKDVKGTPVRTSARLATTCGIKTRRMSKLAE